MKSELSALIIASISAVANGYLSDLTAAEKMANVINKAAKDDAKKSIRDSKFLNSAMDQLNLEFINPYNTTNNHVGMEEGLAKKLQSEPTTCDAARTISYTIRERSDYFGNQLANNRPDDRILCPVTIPKMQREHELVMGFLLNRLRIFALRAKKCTDNWESKDRLARGLNRVAENRFGNDGEVVRSCKQNNVAVGASCMYAGDLKAGANEVITGMRLTKVGNAIWPEIQVAKVTLFGLIDKSTRKWVGPGGKMKSLCAPIKSLVAAEPTRLPAGHVLTQVQLVGTTKKNVKVGGQKLNFYTGKLDKPKTAPAKKVVKLNDLVSVDIEPVYVSTNVAGAGLRYDVETKTITPVLVAQNMATLKV
uniref:Hypothetical salivary simulium-specific secreted protein n=1 Tax=Simulium guianense TaxID=445764 RepID=F5GTQ2_SIMGU